MAFRRAFSINLLPRAILAFVYMCSREGRGGGGGEYTFWVGMCWPPHGTPNWHPVLKKIPLKLIPHSRTGPILYIPF